MTENATSPAPNAAPNTSSAPGADIELTPAFKQALELLENTDENVFITGKAGTGKSTFLEYFRRHTKKNVVVVAPTGVAALNVKGQTIHSFFNIRPGLIDKTSFKPSRNKKIYGQIDLLIIDEISMVRADLFEAIEATLRQNKNKSMPFGGVQLCVIGDLFQLPPVVSRAEADAYAERYDSPFFFSSPTFAAANFELVKFDTIFRQQDFEFIEILNRLRVGYKNPAVLDYLNQRHTHPSVLGDVTPVTLTTTNAIADGINKNELAQLETPTYTFEGDISGKFDVDKNRLPAPQELNLKVGAQVMFTRNDLVRKRWVNGTIGTVARLSPEMIAVRVRHEDGRERVYDVGPEKWVTYRYGSDAEGKLVQEEAGAYVQYPLMLAWAVTIHKSQGKTLDHVIVDLGRGAFAPGQLYVALSRCRSFEKLVLRRPIHASDIHCDPAVMAFVRAYQQKQQQAPASED